MVLIRRDCAGYAVLGDNAVTRNMIKSYVRVERIKELNPGGCASTKRGSPVGIDSLGSCIKGRSLRTQTPGLPVVQPNLISTPYRPGEVQLCATLGPSSEIFFLSLTGFGHKVQVYSKRAGLLAAWSEINK